ncbi:MAG: hypothetical protein ACYDAG_04970 [Chloroflexota bacterium]
MTVINLTPYVVNVRNTAGEMISIPPTEPPARVAVSLRRLPDVAGFAVHATEFGEVVDLPLSEPDTILIVSRIVRDTLPLRGDLFCPGPAIRDQDGRVVGADGLSI